MTERDDKFNTRNVQGWKNFKGRTKPCYSGEFISGEREEDDVNAIGGDSDPASYQEETQVLRSNITITHSPEKTPTLTLGIQPEKDNVQFGSKIIKLELNS